MRIAFAGTPAFAAVALEALIAAGHELCLVLTQPDRPAGRGRRLMPSAVKTVALAHDLALDQPVRLRAPEQQAALRAAAPELMVVAAYGLILPPEVLAIPPLGCLNIHASLLPRWRGAAPIHRAIAGGDTRTGITIMQMDAGLDTGPMLLSAEEPVLADDTTGSLHDRLAQSGARLICEAIARLPVLTPIPQPDDGVTYADKISKDEAALDCRLPASVLARRVRAFNPAPGASLRLQSPSGEVRRLKVWAAGVADRPVGAAPGMVLPTADGRLQVACGTDALVLHELQREGARRMPAAAFLVGQPLAPGTRCLLPDEGLETGD